MAECSAPAKVGALIFADARSAVRRADRVVRPYKRFRRGRCPCPPGPWRIGAPHTRKEELPFVASALSDGALDASEAKAFAYHYAYQITGGDVYLGVYGSSRAVVSY